MIVRIQILKNHVVKYSWAIFVVGEKKTLKDIFFSIKSGTSLYYIFDSLCSMYMSIMLFVLVAVCFMYIRMHTFIGNWLKKLQIEKFQRENVPNFIIKEVSNIGLDAV